MPFQALPPEAATQCGCWSPEDYKMRWVLYLLMDGCKGCQAECHEP